MSAEDRRREFLQLMAPAVWEAARIARGMEGRVQNSPKSGEATAVKQALTVADIEAQEAVLQQLYRYFPDVSLAAEEDTPSVASFAEVADELVIVDPIDGTLHSYLEASGPYAVMVGLAVKGRYEASLVAMPREGLCFGAARDSGAQSFPPLASPRAVRAEADGDRVLVSHGMPEPVCDHLRSQGLEVIRSCGGAVSVAPLVRGVRAGLRYAAGELGVSIRGRIGALISSEAGALVRGLGGGEFPQDTDTPAPVLMVAMEDGDLDILSSALATAGIGAD